jgi:predicted metal-dependent hydrolase
MEPVEYDARYLQGIALFNDFEFFESHDVWEELWSEVHGEARKFYQGMIQMAVCLHHFGNGNIGGARKLYHSSRKYLEPYRPNYFGLDLDRVLGQFDACCAQIVASEERYPDIEIDADLIPELQLDPPADPNDQGGTP